MKLVKINLNKIKDCNHPDINLRNFYLAKIDNELVCGKFSRQWYGLTLDIGFESIDINDEELVGLWKVIQ